MDDEVTALATVADGHARTRTREIDAGMIARIDRVTPDIIAAIEIGNFPRTAAQAAGIPIRTWNQWKQWADQGVLPCVELFERVSCALAKSEMTLVDTLKRPPLDNMGKADTGWIKATTLLLERVHREQWGERVEVRIKVEDSMRELMDDLQARMSPESFDEFVIALADVTTDDPGAD